MLLIFGKMLTVAVLLVLGVVIYKAGIVFFKFETLEEMQDKTARMTELAKVIVE